ncbi:hypothetical protein OH799_19325 [Nocardia sp. NBC_00881]|uniref:hypothetical protein n=1 Tax=Nocardia sp. NBC_00881 TaxID=2975995 RepID=UPI00386F7EA9|nr:hypothetical protein OH799_19325 [Nocardia sp. NBC_00881]
MSAGKSPWGQRRGEPRGTGRGNGSPSLGPNVVNPVLRIASEKPCVGQRLSRDRSSVRAIGADTAVARDIECVPKGDRRRLAARVEWRR